MASNKTTSSRIIQVNDEIKVGTNIKNRRKELGLKQTEFLAKLQIKGIDISIYSLNRIENGTQNPTVSLLLASCDILMCDMNTLFGMKQ